MLCTVIVALEVRLLGLEIRDNNVYKVHTSQVNIS